MDAITIEVPAMGVKKTDLEKELTNKFLSGEMSFADYSSEWYMNEDVEEVEIDNPARSNEDEPHPSSSMPEKAGLKRGRRFTRLSHALLGLMGEANLRFARGDVEMAERMCHEIIKQVPTASEPYQTLAQIYEHDKEKNLQFSLLGAHLRPADANEWLRLAAISSEMKDYKQEMSCYTQAVRAEPYNIEMHLKRIEAFTRLEEISYPTTSLSITKVKCYHKIVNSLPPSEVENIMKYAKLAITSYHNSNEIDRALEVAATAYKKCSAKFTVEDLNIFLELLISQKQFHTCIELFVANASVEIEAEILTVESDNGEIEEQTNYVNCTIPNDLPIDLKSKLLVCFINLGALNLVETLLDDFLSNSVEKAGDLYMDIEESLSSLGYYSLALQLLEPLVTNPVFDLGAVWLKYADCLNNLGKCDEAIASYYKVLKHAPQHPDARKKLFTILEKKGKYDEAIEILQQDYKYVVSAGLLYEQCCVLKKYNKMLKYLEVGEALLSKNFIRFRHTEELNIAFNLRGGINPVHSFRASRGENPYNEDDIHFDEDETFKLTPEEEWALFTELIDIAQQNKLYYVMQRLSYGAVASKNLAIHRAEIDYFCLQSSLLNNDNQRAFRFIREFSLKNPCPRAWNILNLVVSTLEENTHSKFLSRLFQKENSVIRNLFLGNNFLISGRYIAALKYFLDYHDQFADPLSALMIAITILVMASQRTVDKHHNLVLQGMAYLLKYQNLRECDQETYYNMGRAYHMLSITNLAVEYYERALACDSIIHCEHHGVIDLKRETAYNLYLLYKDHAPQISRKYLLKYLVI